MSVTVEQIQGVMPRAKVYWILPLLSVPQKWGIDTPAELASFIAQIAHESSELTRLEENLNYSAEGLMRTWPKRFTSSEMALDYAHQPRKIANYVYANRMGNGDVRSGDGWFYRGRCPIQLTGKDNYERCGDDIDEPLIDMPDLLLSPNVGITAACWFWKVRDLDRYDDDEDARMETKIINGGEHGLALRQAYLDRARKAFGL